VASLMRSHKGKEIVKRGLAEYRVRQKHCCEREAITRPALVPDAQPEYACRFHPFIQTASARQIKKSEKRNRTRMNADLADQRGLSPYLICENPPNPPTAFGPATHRHEGPNANVNDRPAFYSSHFGYGSRPLRLWPKPKRICVKSQDPENLPLRVQWAGKEYRITCTWGPERIETGWWRGDDIHRDYYVITTHVGTRFWVFRRHDDGCWFLHGCFD